METSMKAISLWVNKHGTGVFKFFDGSQYSGEFKENSINGYGKYQWNDGRLYEGNFKDNKMEGFGRYVWPQGEEYEGEYKNDKRHGKGKFKWPDGRLYDGYFEDGMNKLTSFTFNIFTHTYLSLNKKFIKFNVNLFKILTGKKHGEATYTDKKGEVKRGMWKYGKLSEWFQ